MFVCFLNIKINLASDENIINSFSTQVSIDFIPYVIVFATTNQSNLLIILNYDDIFSSKLNKNNIKNYEIIKLHENFKLDFHICEIKSNEKEKGQISFAYNLLKIIYYR